MVIIICRCRHGYFHVVNNDYTHWEMYAIGGSAAPTINSQGNRYLAPTNRFAKEVDSDQILSCHRNEITLCCISRKVFTDLGM